MCIQPFYDKMVNTACVCEARYVSKLCVCAAGCVHRHARVCVCVRESESSAGEGVCVCLLQSKTTQKKVRNPVLSRVVRVCIKYRGGGGPRYLCSGSVRSLFYARTEQDKKVV